MVISMRRAALLSLGLLCASIGLAEDAQPEPVEQQAAHRAAARQSAEKVKREPSDTSLVPGRWIYQCPQMEALGLGVRWERVVVLAKENDRWTIQFIAVCHPFSKGKPAVKVVRGPFPLEAKAGVISFEEGDQNVQYTFCMTDKALVFPAIIHPDRRTWYYKSPEQSAEFRCEFDPFETPAGTAEFPSNLGKGLPGYYLLTQHAETPPNVCQILRFMTRMPEGGLVNQWEFTWNDLGAVRATRDYEHPFREHVYRPLGDKEFQTISQIADWQAAGGFEVISTKRGSGSPTDYTDYLAGLQNADGKFADEPFTALARDTVARLAKTQVPTIDKAKQVALEYNRGQGAGEAREQFDVTGLVRSGRNVEGFAQKGDFIWIVRFVIPADRGATGGITQQYWISSTTGAVRSVFGPN
jgi:hypothetical protein